MMIEYFSKMYVYETKAVSRCPGSHGEKTRGENMKDSLAMLLKTHGGKMPDNGLLAMLMKTKDVHVVSRDVDEKTWS